MKLFIISNICLGLWVHTACGQPSDTANRNRDEWYKEEWPTQPYAFGYEIRDTSGNEQYRKEMSDGDRVTGSYGYLGPDGLYRHVEYVADENGFRAKIRTSEPGTANGNPSNIEIDANPIRVPAASGSTTSPGAINPSPGGGYRRDEVRPNPDRSTVNVNRQPNRSTINRNPQPSRGFNNPVPDIDRNRNKDPDISRPISTNIRDGRVDDTRSDRNNDVSGVLYNDIPQNVVPYRGANPPRPQIEEPPRRQSNDFEDRNLRRNPEYNRDSDRAQPQPQKPNYDRNRPNVRIPVQTPNPSSGAPYDRSYDRNEIRHRESVFDDSRGQPNDGSDGRRYEVSTKGGSTKTPPKNMGFIEATKGPGLAGRPPNKFYDTRPLAQFDDDNEDQYDQFKRRQDDDRSVGVISKPIFENRDSAKGGVVRTRPNTTQPEVRTGVKTVIPIRDVVNRTTNRSSFDPNQVRRDGPERGVNRPTKVFVTSGPISGIADKRLPPIKGDDRSFGAIDVQQRHIDVDYEDNSVRDGHRSGGDGVKDQTDRDRPLRPVQREQKPSQAPEIRPYFGARHDSRDKSQDTIPPKRPQNIVPKPRVPVPPYDPRIDQNIRDSEEDIPVQRNDEFPVDQQPGGPQVFQPLRPNHRPDRQPSPPRRSERPYKPRTQSQDRQERPYVEQRHIDVEPYQTQNSATISSPVNTIQTAYEPIDSLDNDEKSPENEFKEKPSLQTPLSPSSYVITPFPIAPANESRIEIKPILDYRPDGYTVAPELTQMEIPKFGTRIRNPEAPPQDTYEPVDEIFDDKVDQQIQVNDNNDNSDDSNVNPNDYQNENPNPNQNDNQNEFQNSNEYQNENLNDSPIDGPIDSPNVNPIDNPISNPEANPQTHDNVENDQYYTYYDDTDQTQDVRDESKESPKSLIYTQTLTHRSDEKVNINSNPNSSSPIEIRHKVMNVINWHKYDTIDEGHNTNV